jgi:RNA polymerase sigma-70 factor (ECF subfamily)
MIDLERLRRGDRGYLEALVRSHGPLTLLVARAYGTDGDHAEDLFQEIWRHVFQKRRSYRGDGSFEAWLHRLATNVCINDFRTRKVRSKAHERMGNMGLNGEHAWNVQDPLDEAERRELHRRLHRALGHLSDREHQAICFRILEGKTPEEVARIMGIKKSTVRSTIRHGIERLRELMEVSGDELSGYQSSH